MMKRHFFAVVIVGFVFASSVFGDDKKIQVRWEELAGVVQGKKVEMVLRNGEDLEGRVQAVEPQALQIKVSKASGRYEKGIQSVPRSEVSVLRFQGRSGPWRGLGTAIGAGGAVLASLPVWAVIANETGERQAAGSAICVGVTGAGLGYLIGRSADRHVFVVSIVD